ncbi:hypothetical protein [Pseudonocardia nigra]|uniref:hypothetical protein n=1 Tax=Pseudonocardia nigra TaxID=1921578 RepID=UPI0027E28864|nr:hypothetical protein [Pseudonocardia nigra]
MSDEDRAAAMRARERAAYRAFVRENHPDRGGDPDVFVAGLARFRSLAEANADHPDDARYDAPVEVVPPMSLPVRVGVALIRTWHRRRRRRVE